MEFNDILNAIGSAITNAQMMLASYQLDAYKSMLKEKDEQGARRLKTISIPYPRQDGGEEVREIPLAALVNPVQMSLEEVCVKMTVNTALDEGTGKITMDLRASGGGTEGARLNEIQLVFKRGSPPEGQMRVHDDLVKVI